MIDFRNVNTLWTSILVETLHHLGLTNAIICPGSRSTPLAIAFANHPHIEAIPILDERAAGFFALGMAKKLSLPVALVCTSGTAAANLYPAVIEAKYSHVPLLILTADRPPELRDCHAGQTIDQLKLYGDYSNWYVELATPSTDIFLLKYLRQTLIQAWMRSLFPFSGIVHINLPFREPLTPITQPQTTSLQNELNIEDFLQGIQPNSTINLAPQSQFFPLSLLQEWQQQESGLIIIGLIYSSKPQEYCQRVANLAQFLGFPVLAEALSPLRNYAAFNPYLISTYDLILRNQEIAEQLAPKTLIQIGELPTSKILREWLESIKSQRYIIDINPDNFDPLHSQTIHLKVTLEQLTQTLPLADINYPQSSYLKQWVELEAKARRLIDHKIGEINYLFEGKAAWLISQSLPPQTPIFIANSMSVRYAEFFWQPNNDQIIPYFNRGANGIDGTLSTALGIAHNYQSSVMLTGDLALLHDTNGFLIKNKFRGHLTIILINNQGGGIFEHLPIAQFEPPFEEFFATPQHIDFAQLSLTYGVEYHQIASWEKLQELLNPLPTSGIRILELFTDRKADAYWLQENFKNLAETLSKAE